MVGHPLIVQELMWRQNVEEVNADSNANGSKVKKKEGKWLNELHR